MHLRLGYERWKKSRDEWKKSRKKALLFIMCEDTEAANQIATRLNTDETFVELRAKTINLHTNLKGKIKKGVFVEDEKEISDEDLKVLRKLSRELDANTSPYECIVSVLMLREGWDVRNVTTIVPLRPYSSKANILPEQTLGRGLRRMMPPGNQGANEIVTVVEHPAFASLYAQELEQQGLPIEIVDIDKIPTTTISIYPDEVRKDLKALEIQIPTLAPGVKITSKLEGLTLEDVGKEFRKYKQLPLGSQGATEIEYEGRHLLTGEIIERMKIHLPLLESGMGAISYFVRQLEEICKVKNLHQPLAPLMQAFLEEILFDRKTTLFDQALISRLGDPDVAEHIRAVFVPLIRTRTIKTEKRIPAGKAVLVSHWKPYQVTHSERRPALEVGHTLFNLVPCNRQLEVAMSRFVDNASDIAAFAKNAGPQCLRIDYIASGGRLAFYTPDFFVRAKGGTHYLLETKGREDRDVPRKARAAMAWCASASKSEVKWEYLYVPEAVFELMTGNSIAELARTCAPALQNLIETEEIEERLPLFAELELKEEKVSGIDGIVTQQVLESLPPRYRKAVQESVELFRFMEKKPNVNFSPVFTALLGVMDEAARGLMLRRLGPKLPAAIHEQKAWFNPYLESIEYGRQGIYDGMAKNLKKTLVFKNGVSPLGLLRNCLEFGVNDPSALGGVFDVVKIHFGGEENRKLLSVVAGINDFRNTWVAHQEKELVDAVLSEQELKRWIGGLREMNRA